MYCPNCGNSGSPDLKYCRACGLGLEKISAFLESELRELGEEHKFFNVRLFRKLSAGFLYSFLGVGFLFLFSAAVYYKFLIFGPEMMAGFAVFGFLLLGFLAAVFFGVRKHLEKSAGNERAESPAVTSRLEGELKQIENPGFEPARSVTEETTAMLDEKIKIENR